MNATLVSAVLAVACCPALLSCAMLLLWMLRRRRMQVPRRSPVRATRSASRSAEPRHKPEWVCKKVVYLAAHLRSCRAVAIAFNRWHGQEVTIGKTFAWEVITRRRAEIEELRREIRRRPPSLVAPRTSWALDLTFLKSPHGFTFTIIGILDAGSRRILRLTAVPGKCGLMVLGHLLIAFAEHGLPSFVRTDNEAMFTSRLWTSTLRALAIVHRRGPPGQPWRNGGIERFFGTVKEMIGKAWPHAPDLLQPALNEFMAYYNVARPHQALGGLTPAEAWEGKSMLDVQRELAGRFRPGADIGASRPAFARRE